MEEIEGGSPEEVTAEPETGEPEVVVEELAPIAEPVAEVSAAPVPEAVEADALEALLIYSGPSASLTFEGVEFPYGVPVKASAAMAERLLGHALAAEGHRLTLAE